jgi:hypothetical protein
VVSSLVLDDLTDGDRSPGRLAEMGTMAAIAARTKSLVCMGALLETT